MSGIEIHGIELKHNVHPELKEYHQSVATSKKDLRETRTRMHQLCSVCLKGSVPGVELRHCKKCQQAWYCSKECQKKNWSMLRSIHRNTITNLANRPLHKSGCKPPGSTIKMAKFSENLPLASGFLNGKLQLCCILAFDLLHQPQLDKPFVARVDIGIEPTDLMDFMGIYTGKRTVKTQGMVQLNAFTVLPAEAIEENMMTVWRQARNAVTAMGGATSPVGILLLSKANALVHIADFPITPHAMQLMGASPIIESTSSLTGLTEVKPFDIGGAMEVMNKHIRADTKNRLSMRSEMTSEDIQTIRDAANGNVLGTRAPNWPMFAATILKAKIARESMHNVVVQMAS
ncbi:hypothetical protein C8R43DRAFT_1240220 [Mycena crocata]|nr:hypothetical protein C8R43DRAFT_1240220 [Mycena crocata]